MITRLNAVIAGLAVVLVGEIGFGWWLGVREEKNRPTVVDHVRSYVNRQFHDCIPLGWQPVRTSGGTYYPGVNLNAEINNTAFQALWVAVVPPSRRSDPGVDHVRDVMDRLVDAKVLFRSDDSRGVRYNLTRFGQQFFFQDSEITGNPEDWPYVCYSKLHVDRIATRPISSDDRTSYSVRESMEIYWHTEPDGDWVTPELRREAITLRPSRNPAVATVCSYTDGEWSITPFASDNGIGQNPKAKPQC